MFNKARRLVTDNIKGTRKGINEPNSLHSLRVYEKLKAHGYSETIAIAGLLHDIVEDSRITLADLYEQGFSSQVVSLVEYVTHDPSIRNNDLRWLEMIVRIARNKNYDALAIKVCDVIDNLSQCEGLSADRQLVMRNMKALTLYQLGKNHIKQSLLDELCKLSTSS